MSKRWGDGTFLIPAPLEVDKTMKNVPGGKVITADVIRSKLTNKHGTTIASPHIRRSLFFKSPILRWIFFAYFMSTFMFRLTSALGYRGEVEFVNRLGNVFVRQYLVWPTIAGTIFVLTINPPHLVFLLPDGDHAKDYVPTRKGIGTKQEYG